MDSKLPVQRITAVVIALFLGILLLPDLQQITHLVPIVPVVESRARVPLPPGNPLTELWSGGDYYANYERHYNDIFGFRDFFIRLRNQIQYSLFHSSNQVIIGKDGWIADRSSVDVEQRTVDNLTPEQWARLRVRLGRLKAILAGRGIDLLVVPVPIKNTVYPEEFPDATSLRPAETGEAKFRAALSAAQVPFVDVYRILAERKKTVGVFYKTDLHWNNAGAAAVARVIVATLAKRFHAHVSYGYGDSSTPQPFENGTESSVMALLWPLRDMEPAMLQNGKQSCGTFAIFGLQSALPYSGFTNTCPGPLLPPATMFGNSFMFQLEAAHLQDYFSEFYRVYDIDYFHEILTAIRPHTKIVIWQLFELEIGYQLQSDAWWHDVDTAVLPAQRIFTPF